jgi:lysophospholipase L1-like esterase
LPREASPTAQLRVETTEVNRLILDCADGEHVIYADIGNALLDGNGQLTTEISPDALHFTAPGYALLASRLEPELDRLLRPAR